jgi:hypothetical protein
LLDLQAISSCLASDVFHATSERHSEMPQA